MHRYQSCPFWGWQEPSVPLPWHHWIARLGRAPGSPPVTPPPQSIWLQELQQLRSGHPWPGCSEMATTSRPRGRWGSVPGEHWSGDINNDQQTGIHLHPQGTSHPHTHPPQRPGECSANSSLFLLHLQHRPQSLCGWPSSITTESFFCFLRRLRQSMALNPVFVYLGSRVSGESPSQHFVQGSKNQI